MSTGKRVAVVTGANKGIGYAIVRGLCKKFDGDVILTARNESLGQQAVKDLNGEGLHPKFHQLDITDTYSCEKLKSFLQSNYGGLDILVNNAGMAFKRGATESFAEQAEVSVKTNFWGTLNACNSLFPLLRPHARVVNVSTRVSHMDAKKCSAVSTRVSHMDAKKCSAEMNARFAPNTITVPEVEQLMTEFVSCAKAGNLADKDWAGSAYGCSKIGVTLLSFAQQREFDKDTREDIVLNASCPGYVDTDMSSHMGIKTIDEGADTEIYLALLPPNTTSPKGEFVAERVIQVGFPEFQNKII